MTSVLTHLCIGLHAAACVAVYPIDRIDAGEDQDDTDPDGRRDGGASTPEGSVSAIAAADTQPEQWQSYRAKNATFVS